MLHIVSRVLMKRLVIFTCAFIPKGFQCVADENVVTSNAEKAVKQCIYQLHQLNHVWRDVLPAHIMYKSIGMYHMQHSLENKCR